MSTNYYLQKIPVEAVQPGFSLAIRDDGEFRLFQVECTQMSQRSGRAVRFTLTSEPVAGGGPGVLENEAGTPVGRVLGGCPAASQAEGRRRAFRTPRPGLRPARAFPRRTRPPAR